MNQEMDQILKLYSRQAETRRTSLVHNESILKRAQRAKRAQMIDQERKRDSSSSPVTKPFLTLKYQIPL